MPSTKPEPITDRERDAVAVLAHLYLENGKAAQALSLLQALRALFPSDGEVACLLGLALLATADPRAAAREVEAGLRLGLNPEHRRAALLLKSQALWQCGRPHEARAALAEHLAFPSAAP